MEHTPLWMDVSPTQQPVVRRGATPPPRSGLHTLVFFGLITVVVAAAGIAGVTVWGPDKTVTSRSRLASDPPPAVTMPSLPEEAPPAPAESAAAAAEASASATPADPAPPTPTKKTKKAPAKPSGKRSH